MMGHILDIFDHDSTLVDLNRQLSKLKNVKAERHQNLSVAVLANFSTQFLVKGMQAVLQSSGYNPKLFEAGFNQWELELQNENSELYQFNPDVVLVLLSSRELILNPISQDSERFVKYLHQLLVKFQSKTSSKVIVSLPEMILEGLDQTSVFYKLVNSLRQSFRENLRDVSFLVDLDPLIMSVGISKWHSTKFFINGGFSCHPNSYPVLANHLCHVIEGNLKRRVKLVITDLDNTLWKGIVGDIGAENVDLTRDGAGHPHLMMQRHLLDLKQNGVLLAICSKNNPEVVEQVFKNRSEMILKYDDFVDAQINWEPKSTNIKKILKKLNLTESGVVFIDDQQFEREEVSAMLPEVHVPSLPDDATEWGRFVAEEGVFRIFQTSTSDAEKYKQYQQEDQRKQEEAKFENYEEFLKSLQLHLTVQKVTDANFDRVYELIHKTNQFNLRSVRHSRSELMDIISKQENLCFCYSLTDKHGDYGIISVLLVTRSNDTDYFLDTFLMSCRTMGRKVEFAIFDHFVKSNLLNCKNIIGEYLPTPKNKPVINLLKDLGFKNEVGGKLRFVAGKDQSQPIDFIQTEMKK